ncbi:MAG: hypothetical protein JSR83_21930 [Proteobacteria bacterium]|nr:hypothetical protein [Pseudomonadota bacterium]
MPQQIFATRYVAMLVFYTVMGGRPAKLLSIIANSMPGDFFDAERAGVRDLQR